MMNEQIAKHMKVIFSRVWILLVLAIVAAGVVYINSGRAFEKKYEAKMKLIITLNGPVATNTSVFDSIRSSQLAVGDISQIIDSDAVLTGVEKDCNVDRLYISKVLKVDAIPNTRILGISAEMNTPERALKLVESLNTNLNIAMKEIDSIITYKILSMPNVDPIPVNRYYPLIFAFAAALGGLTLGAVINLIIGEKNLLAGELNYIHNLFEEENILMIPAAKIPKHERGAL
jgi:capsular polysaccharide biosynthesis protein